MCIRLAKAFPIAVVFGGLAVGSAAAQGYPQSFAIGVPAAASDIEPIDIAIPADGRGLPAGKGDHATGKLIYEKHAPRAMAPISRASRIFRTCRRARHCV